jgi:diadenosine tetraphosphate (Ap4A) HIT family hydrolase
VCFVLHAKPQQRMGLAYTYVYKFQRLGRKDAACARKTDVQNAGRLMESVVPRLHFHHILTLVKGHFNPTSLM